MSVNESICSTPIQQGYQLEEYIHTELSRLSGVQCYRENDIKEEFKDTSLNGVDHWIKKGNVHVFIQDKWKETNTQPEIAQYLTCVERLKRLLTLPEMIHLVWVSKTPPTAFGIKLLEEKGVLVIVNSKSIQSLAREVYWRVGDLLEDTLYNSAEYVEPVVRALQKEKKVSYDETEEGAALFGQLTALQTEIHGWFQKVIMVINNCGGEVRMATIHLFPSSIEKWGEMKKIDYNAFLRQAKKLCVATKTNRVMSHYMEYYAKMRALSVSLSQPITKYTLLRDKLKDNKSLKVKQMSELKCQPEPMSQSEFTAGIKNANGYYQGMELNFGTYYYNV